jgi:hypothetical protein
MADSAVSRAREGLRVCAKCGLTRGQHYYVRLHRSDPDHKFSPGHRKDRTVSEPNAQREREAHASGVRFWGPDNDPPPKKHKANCPIGTASSEGICTCGADSRPGVDTAALDDPAVLIYAYDIITAPDEWTPHYTRAELLPMAKAYANQTALSVALEAARQEATDVTAVLDEKHAPTESGGIVLSNVGRIRALWSSLVIDANIRAGRITDRADIAEAELAGLRETVTALTEALKVYGNYQHWAIDRTDWDFPKCIWIGPGATERVPNAPEIALAALARLRPQTDVSGGDDAV